MSGFASKLSAAGTRGWKDLQSLWSQKTTLTSSDTSPGEKSSLLSRSYGSGGESPKNHLLKEDESWGDWTREPDRSSGDSSTKANITNPEWSICSDDDLEVWLNDETSTFSFTGKSTKKNTNWNSKYTAVTSNQKEPLVGNLLDLEDGYDGVVALSSEGCDNKGWTAVGQ